MMPDDRDLTTSNPTSIVEQFRRQVVMQVHFWTVIFLSPFLFLQISAGHYLLALFIALFLGLMIITIHHLRQTGNILFQGRGFALLAIITGFYSIMINGYSGLFWMYPLICSLFFLLQGRQAVFFALVTMVGTIVLSHQVFGRTEFWRITASISMTTVIMAVFSRLLDTLNTQLTRLATIDPLTDCLNRSQLSEFLSRALANRSRHQHPACVVLLDLDHFKAINDRYGHQAGDTVLVATAELIRKRARQTDSVFRIGGEEFLVLLPLCDERQAQAFTQSLLESLASTPMAEGHRLTASAGIAEVIDGETWSHWLRRADSALYRAKSAGRNRLVIETSHRRVDADEATA